MGLNCACWGGMRFFVKYTGENLTFFASILTETCHASLRGRERSAEVFCPSLAYSCRLRMGATRGAAGGFDFLNTFLRAFGFFEISELFDEDGRESIPFDEKSESTKAVCLGTSAQTA